MKLLPSIFKNRELQSKWKKQWPSCTQPKTLSFRSPAIAIASESIEFSTTADADELESLIKGVVRSSKRLFFEPKERFFDHEDDQEQDPLKESLNLDMKSMQEHNPFEESLSLDMKSMQEHNPFEESLSLDMKTMQEHNPFEESLSLGMKPMQEHNPFEESLNLDMKTMQEDEDDDEEEEHSPFKESVVLAMESEDPYNDFKKSMEEMVESYNGIKDWEWLQELLGWYLKMNGNGNYGFIVGAFVDLVLELSENPKTSPYKTYNSKINKSNSNFSDVLSTSYSSALSCLSSSSPPSSPLSSLGLKEIEEEK